MTEGQTDSINPSNILPEGTRRVRRPVGRLIDQYIRDERELILDGVPDDEIEKAVLDSVSGDESCNSDEADHPDEEEDDPDYMQVDGESDDDDEESEEEGEESDDDVINLEDEESESEDDEDVEDTEDSQETQDDDSCSSTKRAKTTPSN